MSTPIRGAEAVKAMRDLFNMYLDECDRIDACRMEFEKQQCLADDDYPITAEERIEVFERRRDAIAAKLENKGFKVTAESNDTLPSIARAREGME